MNYDQFRDQVEAAKTELEAYRAPQSSTPTDVITANGERANGEEGKVLLDGQLIIMSDDRTYSAQGQLVK